jgi:hypothetical protein
LVAARLGYEPFDKDAALRVSVRFGQDAARGLRAEVELFDATGREKGKRVLTSPRGDCEELATTTALTISIMLDPRSGMAARPVPPPPPPLPKEPPVDEAPTPPPPPPPKEPFYGRARVDADVIAGLAPSIVAPGLELGFGVGQSWWSVEAELRGDWPTRASGNATSGYEVEAGYFGAGLIPCAHFAPIYGCMGGWLGALRTSLTGGTPPTRTSFHASLGPRFGVSVPIHAKLDLDAHLDGLYAPTATEVYDHVTKVWSTSPVSAVLGFGVLGRFP